MKTLAKYIVIPIKNVQYMIKGINVGGVNRIEYLNYLKQKQEENIIQLKKSYEIEMFNEENNDLRYLGNFTTSNMNVNLDNITQNNNEIRTKDITNETRTKEISNSNMNREREEKTDKENYLTTTKNIKKDTTDIIIEKENRAILHKLNKNETGYNSSSILNFEE